MRSGRWRRSLLCIVGGGWCEYFSFFFFFLGDGKWLMENSMCGSEDSDVFLWDVNSKEPAQILVGHEDVVLGCSAHPTEKVLATGGLDKTVKIWVDES